MSLLPLATLVAGATAWWWWHPERVEVSGTSMTPALEPGDRLLVVRARRVGVGDVVALADPRQPQRLLLKRVRSISDSSVIVVGDNPTASTDSRHFGPVPLGALRGRACYRYAPPDRVGPLHPPARPADQPVPFDQVRAGANPDGRQRRAPATPRR